uniref:Uncharacterized protein n=1 Tax=Mycena chlorophos TaxID=658473 RepID=A0ABQ0LET3_MYCCL|nr:predicted protein [Mycena chlorophos]
MTVFEAEVGSETLFAVCRLLLAPFVPWIRPTLRSKWCGWCLVVSGGVGRPENHSLSLTKRLWTTDQHQVVPAAPVPAFAGCFVKHGAVVSVHSRRRFGALVCEHVVASESAGERLAGIVGLIPPTSPQRKSLPGQCLYVWRFPASPKPLALLETSTPRFRDASSSMTCEMVLGHTGPLADRIQRHPGRSLSSTSSLVRIVCPDSTWPSGT